MNPLKRLMNKLNPESGTKGVVIKTDTDFVEIAFDGVTKSYPKSEIANDLQVGDRVIEREGRLFKSPYVDKLSVFEV